jgi:hypothetical protein
MEASCSSTDNVDVVFEVVRHECDNADEDQSWNRHLVAQEAACAMRHPTCRDYVECKAAIASE